MVTGARLRLWCLLYLFLFVIVWRLGCHQAMFLSVDHVNIQPGHFLQYGDCLSTIRHSTALSQHLEMRIFSKYISWYIISILSRKYWCLVCYNEHVRCLWLSPMIVGGVTHERVQICPLTLWPLPPAVTRPQLSRNDDLTDWTSHQVVFVLAKISIWPPRLL